MRIHLFTLGLFFLPCRAFAQEKPPVNALPPYVYAQPLGVKLAIIDSLVLNNEPDASRRDSTLDRILSLRDSRWDEDLDLVMDLIRFQIHLEIDSLAEATQTDMEAWLETLPSKKARYFRATVYHTLAEYNWHREHRSTGLEYYIRAYRIYRDLDPSIFPLKARYWYDYANAYYFFRDFQKVKDLLIALYASVPPKIYGNNKSGLNTIGICYRQLGQIDSSNLYFQKALVSAREMDSRAWIGIIQGNLATNMILQGRDDEAVPLLEANIRTSREFKIISDLAFSLVGLGEIRLRQGKPEESLALIDEGIGLMKAKGKLNDDVIRSRMFVPYARALSANGRIREAYEWMDAGRIAADSIFSRRDAVILSGIQLRMEAEQHLATLKAKENEIRTQRLWNGVLAVFLLGIASFTYVFFRQRNRIAREKKRSEELLLNILPAEVASDLKTKGRVEARHFDCATILFTDFKDFTRWVEEHTADDLVADLDVCFRRFDEIAARHGLEKIKTIGDSWMAAAGIPKPVPDHAERAVRAAIEIRDFVDDERRRREATGHRFFEIRIGLHSGPVVAGVIGLRKFTYDIWGDTVNLAARMESSGEPGQVNISESTYDLIKDHFPCESRGKVPAKNKGEIGMYFVGVG